MDRRIKLFVYRGSSQYPGQIRQLLFVGKQKEVEYSGINEFMEIPMRQKAYRNFVDLNISFLNQKEFTQNYWQLDFLLLPFLLILKIFFHTFAIL